MGCDYFTQGLHRSLHKNDFYWDVAVFLRFFHYIPDSTRRTGMGVEDGGAGEDKNRERKMNV